MGVVFLYDSVRGRNPMKRYFENLGRGMSYKTDVIDWLGGNPYEPKTVKEILDFFADGFTNFRLKKLKEVNNLANNEFLFKRGGYRDGYFSMQRHEYYCYAWRHYPEGKNLTWFLWNKERFALKTVFVIFLIYNLLVYCIIKGVLTR
jgi:hypothetical protein